MFNKSEYSWWNKQCCLLFHYFDEVGGGGGGRAFGRVGMAVKEGGVGVN